MKTLCVGRFLIDLPADAAVTLHGGLVAGFELACMPESDEQFALRLARMEAQVAAAQDEQGRPSLEWEKALSLDSAQGKVLVYNRQRGKAFVDGRLTEAEDVSVRGMLRLPHVSIAAEAHMQAPERGDELLRLFGRLRPLDEDEVPRESGCCLGRAIVLDPYGNATTESVAMVAGLPAHPDVRIVLSSVAGMPSRPGLLERHARAAQREPLAVRHAFTTLRERRRAVNGLPGEELAMRVQEPNGTTGFSFHWQAAGTLDDTCAPLLTLALEAGVGPDDDADPVESSLSESGMTALWEGIVGSIRLRPADVTGAALAAGAA
ncbi:T6SS immunity protein Tli4 family protein [Massilia consociata]|uniref:T6SS immunity protein Tli4 family protein n=2 Tax=Massilia consociata TaxID=760117 RepID=A0ABV6FE26_9BURK